MGSGPRARVGVLTCTSKVDLTRSVVSFEGVAVAAGTHCMFVSSRDCNEGIWDVLAAPSVSLAVESKLDALDGVQHRRITHLLQAQRKSHRRPFPCEL